MYDACVIVFHILFALFLKVKTILHQKMGHQNKIFYGKKFIQPKKKGKRVKYLTKALMSDAAIFYCKRRCSICSHLSSLNRILAQVFC